MSQERIIDEIEINLESFTVTEMLKTWLHDLLLTKYESTKESLNFSHRLITEGNLASFIHDCQYELDKGKYNTLNIIEYRFMLWKLSRLKQTDFEKIVMI